MWYRAGPAPGPSNDTMRRAFACALFVAMIVAAPSEPAAAAGSFTFFGSGWGHGIGLSQYGAYGLALDGWGSGRILTHFYSHTRVVKGPAPPRLRIGLVQGRSRLRLTALAGPVDLRLDNPKKGDVVATIPEGKTWTVRVARSKYRIIDGAGKRVGGRVGGPRTDLFASYEPNGARVRIPQAGHTYNRGWVEFNIYSCASACTMRLVLSIHPQDYLYGIAEVPSSWPRAALRAQAIAARTYAFRRVQTSGQHRDVCNCALYASSLDQVYAGWDKEGGLDGRRWVAAVNRTDGQVVVYHGQLIEAFYSSSSGGYTENNENVWGGTPVPYLRGVCDPGDYTPANPNAIWQVSMSASSVTSRLGLGIGRVRRFANVVRGVSGRVISVVVHGTRGRATIGGGDLRSRLGLNDDRVWINANRQVTGSIRLKYDAMSCRPGLPTSRRAGVAGGMRQRFQRSTIFYHSGAGAHAIGGNVLSRYLHEGGPRGHLGFPTTDVHRLKSGARRARFEHGVITCDGGSCTVSGG
jgi:SpoIID/LytB domain protein